MSGLSSADRTKLAKLLGMLGSDHDGECAAAARAAHRFMRDRNASWTDVLSAPPFTKGSLPFVNKPSTEVLTWRQVVDRCLGKPGMLKIWEMQFLCSLPTFSRITPKQRGILTDIASRVLCGGAA